VAVRAVVLDLDGTLIAVRGNPVPGIPEMIAELRTMGMRLAAASNQPGAARKLARAGLAVDFILDKALGSVPLMRHAIVLAIWHR
jgi:phosphoglycolate phosphatase-like HAD superfamily hydrolase